MSAGTIIAADFKTANSPFTPGHRARLTYLRDRVKISDNDS